MQNYLQQIVFVCDDKTSIIESVRQLSTRMEFNVRRWEFDGVNIKPNYKQPVFELSSNLYIDYMTLGLALKCGFNTIFIQKEKKVKTQCIDHTFRKEYIKQREGRDHIIHSLPSLYISRGYPIRRSTYMKGDYDQMRREAEAFQDGKILLGKDDLISEKTKKMIQPIMNYSPTYHGTPYFDDFCFEYLSKISPEHYIIASRIAQADIDARRLYQVDKYIAMYNIIQDKGYWQRYNSLYNKVSKKYQNIYISDMKKLHPHPIF